MILKALPRLLEGSEEFSNSKDRTRILTVVYYELNRIWLGK